MSNTPTVDFDIIIIGTGPAGLAVGSELAQHHKVLLVDNSERTVRGKARTQEEEHQRLAAPSLSSPFHYPKFWFCPYDCLFDNPDLVSTRKPGGVTRFLAKTYSGPTASQPETFDLCWESKLFAEQPLGDRYPYLDEYAILAHFEQKILDAGSEIRCGFFYRDHEAYEDHVVIRFIERHGQSNAKVNYSCKLLIDASGHDSDVRKNYTEEQKYLYWWSVFGATARHPEGQIVERPTPGHTLVVGDYMLWQTFKNSNENLDDSLRQGRPIFEYEIIDKRISNPLILYLRPYKMSAERMRAEFLSILRSEDSTAPFHDVEIEEFKHGWYPSGHQYQSFAQHRVDFVGDAGLWTTPCGWGMGFILKNYRAYAAQLSALVRQDRLDKKSLRKLGAHHGKKAEFFMNALATRFLSYGTARQLDQFIALFNQVDPLICEKVFTLRASPRDLLRVGWAAIRTIGILPILRVVPLRELPSFAGQFVGMVWQYACEIFWHLLGRKSDDRGFGVFAKK